jgi:hypothetical protein
MFHRKPSIFDNVIPNILNDVPEALDEMQRAFQKYFDESADKTYEITAIGIVPEDADEVRLACPVLVVAVKRKDAAGTGYHALLIEHDSAPIDSKFTAYQSQQIENHRTLADAYDGTMRAKITEKVKLACGEPVFANDARVIRRGFNYQDANAVRNLARDAAEAALLAVVRTDREWRDLQLSQIGDTRLKLAISFNGEGANGIPTTLLDTTGYPIRSSIHLNLAAAARNPSDPRTTSIGDVHGFIDPVYSGNKKYIPRFVITQMKSNLARSLGDQLLMLAMTSALAEGGAWWPTFLHGGTMHNIESLSDDDTKEGPSDLDTKLGVIKKVFNHDAGLLISLDVPECGDSTWYNAPFAAMATGDQRAASLIYEATNWLTGGAFDKYWARGQPMAVSENNRIPLGYYDGMTSLGQLLDVRELDMTAVSALTKKEEPQTAIDWESTYLRMDIPLGVRLDARMKIIRALCPGFVLTDHAYRVTFVAQFIQALAASCREAGLMVQSVNPHASFVDGAERPTYQGAGAIPSDSPSFFTSSNMRQQYYGTEKSGRWS